VGTGHVSCVRALLTDYDSRAHRWLITATFHLHDDSVTHSLPGLHASRFTHDGCDANEANSFDPVQRRQRDARNNATQEPCVLCWRKKSTSEMQRTLLTQRLNGQNAWIETVSVLALRSLRWMEARLKTPMTAVMRIRCDGRESPARQWRHQIRRSRGRRSGLFDSADVDRYWCVVRRDSQLGSFLPPSECVETTTINKFMGFDE